MMLTILIYFYDHYILGLLNVFILLNLLNFTKQLFNLVYLLALFQLLEYFIMSIKTW